MGISTFPAPSSGADTIKIPSLSQKTIVANPSNIHNPATPTSLAPTAVNASSGTENAVAYGNGMWVTLSGASGLIATSTNGTTWTWGATTNLPQYQGTPTTTQFYGWYDLKYLASGNYWLAMRNDGRIYKTTDLVTWTQVTTMGSSHNFGGLLHNGTIWLAWHGNSGTDTTGNRIYTSTDGTTWTLRTLPTNWGQCYTMSVVSDRFCIVALNPGSTQAFASYTTDGITWNTTSVGTTFGSATGVAVGMASSGSRLVAAGSVTNGGWYTSTDGVTWTANTVVAIAGLLLRFVWDGTRFVTLENNINRTAYYSTTGTGALTAGQAYASAPNTIAWNITWDAGYYFPGMSASDGAGRIVIVESQTIAGRLASTSDVTSSAWVFSYPYTFYNGAGQQWTAYHYSYGGYSTQPILFHGANFATDGAGKLWYVNTHASQNTTYSSLNYVLYSTDNGVTWTRPAMGLNQFKIGGAVFGDFGAVKIKYLNNTLVILANDRVWYSTDNGSNWSSAAPVAGTILNDITFGNGVWAVITPTGAIYYSSNLSSWTGISIGGTGWTVTPTNGSQIAFNGIMFAAVGFTATVILTASSYDGINWLSGNTANSIQGNSLSPIDGNHRLGGGNGIFVIAYKGGTAATGEQICIATSSDGISYIQQLLDTRDLGNDLGGTGMTTSSLLAVMCDYHVTTGWAIVYYFRRATTTNGMFIMLTSKTGAKWTAQTIFEFDATTGGAFVVLPTFTIGHNNNGKILFNLQSMTRSRKLPMYSIGSVTTTAE